MNATLNTAPDMPAGAPGAPGAIAPMRLMVWCVRRELWENRSLYIAPLVVAALVLFGFFIHALHLPENIRAMASLSPAVQTAKLMMPYSVAAASIIVTIVFVGWFYCLDALHGERRDRSILFWKSLPVSDGITVLSKAAIPFVVMPLIAFPVIVLMQLIMLLLSSLILLVHGTSPEILWTQLTIVKMLVGLGYSLVALVLWHAPIYGWMLLVSAWAQRSTFLWALLPPLAIGAVERIAFDGKYFFGLLQNRVAGVFSQAFTAKVQATGDALKAGVSPRQPMPDLVPDPVKFLSNPDLWIGLVIAFVLIAACIQLRRRREPI